MTNKKTKQFRGFTVVELMVTILIISIVTSIVVLVARAVFTKAKIHTTENTIKIIRDALVQYQNAVDKQDGRFQFPVEPLPRPDYDFDKMIAALDYNLCWVNGYVSGSAVGSAVGKTNHETSTSWKDAADLKARDDVIDNNLNENLLYARSTIEFIYCILNDVPASRAVLEKLPKTAVTNADNDSAEVAQRPIQLLEVIDAWEHPIWYQSTGTGSFPIIRSAGPDAAFNTADDVVSTDF